MKKHLVPFKKGHDSRRNLKGAPRKLDRLDNLLATCLPADAIKKIILAVAKKAEKGDVRAAEVLLDRCYGKPSATYSGTVEFPGFPNAQRITGFRIVNKGREPKEEKEESNGSK